MWKIFKRYGSEPTTIIMPSRLRRRKRNVMARAAIDISNTTEETVRKLNLLKIQKDM